MTTMMIIRGMECDLNLMKLIAGGEIREGGKKKMAKGKEKKARPTDRPTLRLEEEEEEGGSSRWLLILLVRTFVLILCKS